MIFKTLRLSVTNCYLFKTNDGYALIDTGYDWEWRTFCAELRKSGVEFEDIKHLILTHHHDDHAGLINKLLEQNPRIKVVMSRHAKDLLQKGRNDHTRGGGYINRRIYALATLKRVFDKKWTLTFPPYITRNDDILIDQEVQLQQIGIEADGKILETPGHTVDSISIAFGDGDCIVGDAAANFLRFAGTKYCVVYVMDLDQYYESWTRIIEAGAKWIYPSHGRPFGVEELKKSIYLNKKHNMVMTE